MNRGVVEFYYTRQLPARSVAIAKIATTAATPAQLTDVNNFPHEAESLGVWSTSPTSGPADFIAKDYGVPMEISGSQVYSVANPFFELTGTVTEDGTTCFYKHQFSAGVADVKILDLEGNVVETADVVLDPQTNALYHNMDGAPYRVRYVENSHVYVKLLRYDLAFARARYTPGPSSYVFGGRAFQVLSSSALRIRFIRPNGYRVSAPYTTLPNAPWFPRIGTSLTAPAPEWARQVFLPMRPYLLAAWVPGAVLDSHLIEFERKGMLDNPVQRPDILVFDSDYKIKYALEGSDPTAPRRRGTVYHWKRGQVQTIDPTTARVEIALELAPTDIVYGFYAYQEWDVLYTALDVNPFTNPVLKNRIIKFYYRDDSDPFRRIYHQVFEADGTLVVALTNDPTPPDWAAAPPTVFGEMIVGANVGVPQIDLTDVRQRGGGLAAPYQGIPESVNFWDLGYWDGKPYPIGAALVVCLPARILETMSREDVEGKVKGIMPLGVSAVVRYYDVDGEEVL